MTSALTILSQALVYALPQRWIARLLRYPEAVKFLLIATAGTMATTTLFSILKWTALTDNPVTAHMLAALISAVYAYFSEQEFKLGNHVEVLPEIDPNPGIPRSVVADPRFIVASTCAILSLTPV